MKALQLAGSCLVGCFVFAFGSAAVAAPQPGGVALAVVQGSEVDGANGKLVLQPQAPVYSGDRIITNSAGEAQIRFANTKLVVGPNSSLVIDAFVFNTDNSASQVSINAVRGAFRFLTGTSAKDAYSINTPTAVIAVRGTEFDLDVEGQTGKTYLAQIGGQTRICSRDHKSQDPKDRDRHCVDALPGCSIFVADANRDPRELKSKADHNLAVQRKFQYLRNQRGLLAGFRLDVSSCGPFAESSQTPLLQQLAPLAPLVPLVPLVVSPASP